MRRIALAAALLLLPVLAFGQAVTYQDRSGTITLGGTAQQLAPAWSGRHGCQMLNLSVGDLWVNDVGTAAATQPSIKVPAGGQYLCQALAPASALSIFGATTAQAFAAREW